MKPWNASEDAILKSNYGREGVTAEKIGEVLGRTRNSVIGRARDLSLSKPAPHLRGRAKATRVILPEPTGPEELW